MKKIRFRKERKIISCACGCGLELINRDNRARIRRFVHGHNKGHSMPHTAETCAKMSKHMSGKKSSIEIRKKQSEGMNKAIKEGRHPGWKGGITPINEKIRKSLDYKLWRESVFKRDNYTCIFCKEKEKVSGMLEADHIKPFAYYPELRFSINNGRTLCKECHKGTDTYLWKCKKNYG